MNIIRWDGKPISKPGIYAGIPLEVYHSQAICVGPSVSSSNLRRVLEQNKGSPRHMYQEWSGNPRRVEPEERAHLTVGRATHHLVLGEADFKQHFAIRPLQFDSWRTKDSQDWRKHAQSIGLGVLTPAETDHIIGMADSLGRYVFRPDDGSEEVEVKELLTGYIEHSFIWLDKATGLWCKARPDVQPNADASYADLKTTSSVHDLDIFRTIREYAYHQQGALTIEGAVACGAGHAVKDATFYLIFVESKPPYCVRVVEFKRDQIMLGMQQNQRARALISRCLLANHWPGPGGFRARLMHAELGERYMEDAQFEISQIDAMLERDRRAQR